jgi:hypothetical protein
MPTISQIAAVSYPAVLNEMRKAANQWAESAFMRELERQKAIKRVHLGTTIEQTLDYQRNPGTDFLPTDLTTTSLAKVEVLTAAQVDAGQLSVPVVWTKADEAKNPSENQKINFTKALLENAINSHDDAIEEALFASDTDGFYGLPTVVPSSGQGDFEGIDAATDIWWRNYAATYLGAGTDMDTQLTTAWNTAAKGSGSQIAPTLIVSGAEAQALFESTQQANQRWVDTDELKAGFKIIGFKTARWVFSQYGDDEIYGLNPKSFNLTVSKDAFREKGETSEIQNANGFVFKLFSMLQSTTNNKSRLFRLSQVG